MKQQTVTVLRSDLETAAHLTALYPRIAPAKGNVCILATITRRLLADPKATVHAGPGYAEFTTSAGISGTVETDGRGSDLVGDFDEGAGESDGSEAGILAGIDGLDGREFTATIRFFKKEAAK